MLHVNEIPSVMAKGTVLERQVLVTATTDSLLYRFMFVSLLMGLVVVLLGATGIVNHSVIGQSNLAAVVVLVLVLLIMADTVGGRALNSWLHGASHAICSATGMEVPLRSVDTFSKNGEKYELRSPIFRRRLGEFTKPNWLEWSPLVIVRFLPSHRSNYRAMVVLDFRGPYQETSGLRSVFRGVRLWVTAPQMDSLMALAFKGRAHVHVIPKLFAGGNVPLRQCSLSHSMDLNLTGTCLAGLAEDEVSTLMARFP